MVMKVNRLIPVFILILWIPASSLMGQVRISGFVRDKASGEALIGVHLSEDRAGCLAISDNHGYFNLVTEIPVILRVSFVGYTSSLIDITEVRDTVVVIYLEECIELQEVVVKAQKNPVFNTTTLSYAEMINTPSLGAKPDVLKTLQLQPGIHSQNEGSSLLLVRGGNPGENLYLLDNVPLIYVNHIGGFMSVFNPDMINNVTLYKGGFPARYGSKLSSIVDIAQREGNNSALKGSYSLGVTDASFTLEGPLKMKNTTFILTSRKTLIDPLLAMVSKISEGDYIISYGFHDLNGKLSWKPDLKNSLHLNVYQGDDYLNFWSKTIDEGITQKGRIGNIWGNWMGSLSWDHVLSPKLFMSNSLSYTRYRLKDIYKYTVSDNTEENRTGTKYISSVQDIAFRSAWKYILLRNWTMDYGLQASFLVHEPNRILSLENKTVKKDQVFAQESAIYLDNTIRLPLNLEARLGLRAVSYNTKNYSVNKLEPRINLDFSITENQLLNVSYMQINQYSHLIFTSETFLNNEVWVPADNAISPARSQQYTVGWKGYFNNDMFQAGIELYYKELSELATYRESYTSLMGDGNWRAKIETGGRGTAYGAEFSLQKKFGKWTGCLNYTYSRAIRQYPNINNGAEYIYEYDRPNCVSIGFSHQINDKLTFSANWVYQTGLPYTPVVGRQYTLDPNTYIDGKPFYYEAFIYGERNSQRMKDYHRLDLSLQYSRLTKKRKMKSVWSFTVYNVYNRQNPYYYYYNSGSTGEMFYPSPQYDYWNVKLYQVSYFPIIPSISYKVYFNTGLSKDEKSWKTKSKEKFNHWLYQEKTNENVSSTQSYIKKRLNFKLAYSYYAYKVRDGFEGKPGIRSFCLETNYGISNHFEMGGYLGYGKDLPDNKLFNPTGINQYSHRALYGINCNYHFLPYLVKNSDFRFDLYISGKLGGIYGKYMTMTYSVVSKHYIDYGIFGGCSFYLWKHIGTYIEYGYDKYRHCNKMKLRYGLTIKY